MPSSSLTFSTDRLLLRPIEPTDLEAVFRGLSHPEVIPFYGVSFSSLEETREQMEWYRKLVEEETGQWWAVCDKTDGRFLGAGGFNDRSKEHRKAEIGFWLLPENWGKGIMPEGMKALLDFAFGQWNLRRVEGFVEAGNLKCKRGLAKLNFQHEGTMRDCEWKGGRFISLDIYAVLSPES